MSDFNPKMPRPHSISDGQKDWKKQEKRLAKRSGGYRQPGSGSSPHAKGDVKDGHGILLIEAKSTEKKSLSVKRDWLVKISKEADQIQRTPCLSICFTSIKSSVIDQDWACVPFGWLMEKLDQLQEFENGIS